MRGIPIFNTDARVIDPETLRGARRRRGGRDHRARAAGVQGLLEPAQATREAFIEHDGKRFFRTGDLGYYDEEGYFFITDRLKRMINASGFKVWPAEVEAMLYAHPGIQEACVIGARDAYRGETVKAVIVLKRQSKGRQGRGNHRMGAREHGGVQGAAHRRVRRRSCRRTATGKILWRELQEEEIEMGP